MHHTFCYFFFVSNARLRPLISCEINDVNKRGRIFSFLKRNALSRVRVKILKRIPQILQKEIKKPLQEN